MDVTKPYEFIRFGDIHGPKPYEFIGFGAMDVTKAYEFIGFGAMDGTKPYKFIGFGAMDVTKLWLGRSVGPCKKYGFLGFLTRAPGPEAPGRSPWAIRGPSRGLRGPPGGPRDLRQTKAKNLET